jgi:hypothetical protein
MPNKIDPILKEIILAHYKTEKQTNKKLNLTKKDFLDFIGEKAWDEWNPPGTKPYLKYVGQAISEFVSVETHYAIERTSQERTDWKWDGRRFGGLTHNDYLVFQSQVAHGLVRRAIDLLNDKTGKEKLFCSLLPYMPKPS